MIKGISFKIPSNEYKVLEKILKEVDIKDYYCCNVKNQSEAWIEKDRNEAFLKKEIYNGNDFQSQISKEYFIIFLKLEFYSRKPKKIDIHTFEEFKESSCETVMLLYDCEYVEVYSKNFILLNKIEENIKKNGFLDIQYWDEYNKERKVLDIV